MCTRMHACMHGVRDVGLWALFGLWGLENLVRMESTKDKTEWGKAPGERGLQDEVSAHWQDRTFLTPSFLLMADEPG